MTDQFPDIYSAYNKTIFDAIMSNDPPAEAFVNYGSKGYKNIKSFARGDEISQVFRITHVVAGKTKDNHPFATLTLEDSTGTIKCKQWQFDIAKYPEIKAGIYAKMHIKIEDWKGSIQAKSLTKPMPVDKPESTEQYKPEETLTVKDATDYYDKLMKYKDEIKDPFVKAYIETIFVDNMVAKKLFMASPATLSGHGAYRGGLVEHVYTVMLHAMAMVDAHRSDSFSLERDVVIASVLTHQLGKTYQYSLGDLGIEETRCGKLLGYVGLSYSMSIQAFIQTESMIHQEIPEETKDHINHCILAHRGNLGSGSPVPPQSPEAQILYLASMSADSVGNTSTSIDTCVSEVNSSVDDDGFLGNIYVGRFNDEIVD